MVASLIHDTGLTLLSSLKKQLIKDYLKEKGYDLEEIDDLPPDESKNLIKQARSHAQEKMVKILDR